MLTGNISTELLPRMIVSWIFNTGKRMRKWKGRNFKICFSDVRRIMPVVIDMMEAHHQ